MPQSLDQVYLHFVWSTKYRQPLIDDLIEEPLYGVLGANCKKIGVQPIQIGGYKNHVHLLVKFSRLIKISQLPLDVKRLSSKWVKQEFPSKSNFYWQDGYAVFSVNPKGVEVVRRYILNQHIHHANLSFKNECRAYFKKYKIEYDERYVWD